MNHKTLLFSLFLIFLSFCSEKKPNFIIPFDVDTFMKSLYVNGGLTESQARELNIGKKTDSILKSRTLGKTIPDSIYITSINGEKQLLNFSKEKNTLMLGVLLHCSVGGKSTFEDLPKIVAELGNENKKPVIYCLVVKESSEPDSSFFKYLKDYNKYYTNTYFISDSDGKKLNIIGSPMRFYINDKRKVSFLSSGMISPDSLKKEVISNLHL